MVSTLSNVQFEIEEAFPEDEQALWVLNVSSLLKMGEKDDTAPSVLSN